MLTTAGSGLDAAPTKEPLAAPIEMPSVSLTVGFVELWFLVSLKVVFSR